MVQNVLTVRGTVLLTTQNLYKLGVQVVNAGLVAGALALLADGAVNFFPRLFHHVLNAGGMNAAVHNELLQRQPGNLPADGVKAGNGDGFGGVVDDQVDAGNGLQGADVPAFPADDAALHLVVGQRDHGDGGLGGVIGGAALDGGSDDLTALFLGLVLQLRLDLLDLHGGLVANLVLDAVQQEILCLILCQTGNLFQFGQLLLLELIGLRLGLGDLLKPLGKLLFLAFKGFGLLVQSGFLLFQTALLLTQLGAALFDFLVVFCARFMDFVLGFQKHFLLTVFTGTDGFVDQAGSLCLGRADLPLSDLLAVTDAKAEAGAQYHQNANGDNEKMIPFHKFAAHLLLKK